MAYREPADLKTLVRTYLQFY